MPPSYQDSFTSSLRERLHVDRSRITEWANHEKEHIDVLAERYRALATEQQASLDAGMTHYVTLKLQADCKIKEAVKAQESVEELEVLAAERQEEIEVLQVKQNELMAAIRELQLDAIDAKDAVQSASQALKDTATNIQKKLDKLQPSIERYKHLGLNFVRAEDNILRFEFTQINHDSPDAPFSFELTTSDEDEYVVTACKPALNANVVDDLVDNLNTTDDGLSQFIRDMRVLFVAHLTENGGRDADE